MSETEPSTADYDTEEEREAFRDGWQAATSASVRNPTPERTPGESEAAWLVRRLTGDPKRKLRHFNVWWGDDAGQMTTEQRAAAVNRVLDQVASGAAVLHSEFPDERPTVNVREWVEGLPDGD